MTVHPDTKKNSNDGDRFDQFPKWLWGTPSTKDTPAVQPPFSPTTMLVYVALRSHEGMKDGARPSIKRVSEMTGLGERTIWRSIHELNGAGVLKVESRGKSQPNRYHFPSQRSATVADPQVCHTGRSATQAGLPRRQTGSATVAHLGLPHRQPRETYTERPREKNPGFGLARLRRDPSRGKKPTRLRRESAREGKGRTLTPLTPRVARKEMGRA